MKAFIFSILLLASACSFAAPFYPTTAFIPQFFDPESGEIATGFTIESFVANSSTPATMYTDKNGTPAGSVIAINSGGYPEVNGTITNIWLDADLDYKFILRGVDGIAKWTIVDLSPRGTNGGIFESLLSEQAEINGQQDAINGQIQDLFGKVGVNTDNLTQEIIDRASALSFEAQERIAAIQAAIDAAEAGDTSLRTDLSQNVSGLQSSISDAQSTADSALSNSNTALTQISDTGDAISALTLRQESNESTVEAQGALIAAGSNRQSVTESRVNDVLGDGSDLSLEAFAADTTETKAAIENATTGLSATRNTVINTESRLNDVAGNASGKTIEQLSADYESLDSEVAQNASASVQGFSDVSARVDLIDDSIESIASDFITVQAQASTANTTANAAISSAQAANVTANSASGAVSAIASDLSTVEINVNGIQNTVTQQATAINSIEGGVVNQWEVKSTIGDISGAIGLYNDGGSTKVAIDANAFEIWDTATNDTVPAFDFSGGQLSISVPTEIPNLSIGPEKLAAEATAQKIEVRTGSVSPPLNSFDDIFSDIISPTTIFVGAADDIFSQADPLRITVDEGFGSSVKLTVRIVVHQRPRFLWPGATPSSESVVCDTRMDLSIRTATTNGYSLAGSPVLSVMRVYSDSRADDVQTVDMDRNHRFVYEDVLYATVTTDRNIDIAASVYSRRTSHPFTPKYLNNTISSVNFFITIEKI